MAFRDKLKSTNFIDKVYGSQGPANLLAGFKKVSATSDICADTEFLPLQMGQNGGSFSNIL